VGASAYETNGSVPGIDGGCTDDLTVFAHGFRLSEEDAEQSIGDVRRGLSHHGYDGTVVGFSWDSNHGFHEWWSTMEIARRNGEKLARFTRDLNERCPGSPIRYVGHSLGAPIVLSALETLAENGSTATLSSVSLLGAAVVDDEVSLDGQYGHDIQTQTEQLNNFRKPDDSVLNWAFGAAEADGALGSYGIQGPAPDNFSEYTVSSVPSHTDYIDPQQGALDRVVEHR
jgi:esterase/lipase superfamily enzyme